MHEEFEKKGYAPIKKNTPQKGRNTFLWVKPKNMEGLKTLYLFFNDRKILEAVIVRLEPQTSRACNKESNR